MSIAALHKLYAPSRIGRYCVRAWPQTSESAWGPKHGAGKWKHVISVERASSAAWVASGLKAV